MRLLVPFLAVALSACIAAEPEPESVDTDGDGLLDDEESELGTDPTSADSDGDGFADGEELGCEGDPLDLGSTCFECGWPDRDPGTLDAEGMEVGDVVADLDFTDACGEEPHLWGWAGEYHILYLTGAW